ncbi:MAG: hypothetical protein OXB93_04315 [Cytophagales bacterium]|nr:hypothetical protein [Cytophagales bacterium]
MARIKNKYDLLKAEEERLRAGLWGGRGTKHRRGLVVLTSGLLLFSGLYGLFLLKKNISKYSLSKTVLKGWKRSLLKYVLPALISFFWKRLGATPPQAEQAED